MALIRTPDSASVQRANGGLIVDGQHVADTVQCCHCNRQWEVQPGSGRKRGFCMNCMGVTCGDATCHRCVPFEKKLELREKYGRRFSLR